MRNKKEKNNFNFEQKLKLLLSEIHLSQRKLIVSVIYTELLRNRIQIIYHQKL